MSDARRRLAGATGVVFSTGLLPSTRTAIIPRQSGKDTLSLVTTAPLLRGVAAQSVAGHRGAEHGQRGAQARKEEFEVVQYLAKNFPPKAEGSVTTANVNKASAEEIKTSSQHSA